ncbi:hypothetical protein D3C83_158000 [compost metagenome]
MHAEFERGDHAEIAATPAQRPEKIGVLLAAGVQNLAFGGDHVGAGQAVDGEA